MRGRENRRMQRRGSDVGRRVAREKRAETGREREGKRRTVGQDEAGIRLLLDVAPATVTASASAVCVRLAYAHML